jgi:hypothetical protein
MEEKKRGGPRLGAGRKPLPERKVPVTNYVPQNLVEQFKKQSEILIQDLTKSNFEIKPKEAVKSNFSINTSKKSEKPVNEEKRVLGDEFGPAGTLEQNSFLSILSKAKSGDYSAEEIEKLITLNGKISLNQKTLILAKLLNQQQ